MRGFRKLEEHDRFTGRVIRVTTTTFEGPGGERFERDIVHNPGAVAAVPLVDDGDGPAVVLVRQFRGAVETSLLEIPAGLCDVDDEDGEDGEATIRRELIEEIGMRAGHLEELVKFQPAPGFTDQRTEIYLASELEPVERKADGVEEHYMELHQVPLTEARAMVDDGRISDAKTIIGILLAYERLA